MPDLGQNYKSQIGIYSYKSDCLGFIYQRGIVNTVSLSKRTASFLQQVFSP